MVAGGDASLVTRAGKIVINLLAIVLCFYLFLLAFLFFVQTRLIFPVAEVGPPPPLPRTAERLTLTVAEATRLRGVHLPPRGGVLNSETVILAFGGNAWNAESAALILHEIYPEADVVAFHFRGYPPSGGAPGAAAILHDAPLILDFAARHYPGRRIVAVGFSIGTAG